LKSKPFQSIIISAGRTRYDSRCLLLSAHQKAITMRNIYRNLLVLPLLVSALFIAGCDSDEDTPLPPIVIDAPTAGNAEGATDTPSTTPVTNIHGSNSADTSVILDDFQVAVLARPSKIMTSKLVAPIMEAMLSTAPGNQNPLSQLQTQTGIAVTQIDRVLVLGSIPIPEQIDEPTIYERQGNAFEPIEAAPADENQPAPETTVEADDKKPPTMKYGAVITLLDDANTESLIARLKEGGFEVTTVDGRDIWQNSFIEEFAVHIKDNSTIMLGSKPELLQMVAGKGGDNALAELVSSLSGDNLLVVATETKSVFDSVPDWAFDELFAETPQIAPVVAFMKNVSSSAIAINPDSDTPIFIELMTPDEETTIDVFTQVNFFASLGKSLLPNQVLQFEANPNAEPEMIEALKMANTLVQNLSVTKTDNTITVSLETNDALRAQIIKFIKMGIANAKEATNQMHESNDLKEIGLGLHNYHNRHDQLPTGETNTVHFADGKPLLSWRVHILPYVGEQELYAAFHLNEPWDSDHNIKLQDRMPHVYLHPSYPELTTKTVYRAPVCKGSVLTQVTKQTFSSIKDGTSNTGLVIAVGPDHATPWTKPDPILFTGENELDSLGLRGHDKTSVLLADGAVKRLDLDLPTDTWLNLFNANDGNALELP